jgi:hypothetical protein
MARYRLDASAVCMLLTAYTIVFGLFGLWFYSFFVPTRHLANPGISAYKPPPATVINYEIPARALVQDQQAPPVVEVESRPEQPMTAVPASTGNASKVVERPPERIINVKKPQRPKSPGVPHERDNPLNAYAAARFGNAGAAAPSRYHGAGAYPGYLGDRPF